MPQEYTARWQGGRVGAGATVLHFESVAGPAAAQAIANAVRTFFDTIKGQLPDDVTVRFDAEVLEISDSGTLLGTYPVTAPASVTGTGTGSFQNGSGVLSRHNTGVILGGRRVIGRTFIVPAANAVFGVNGDVATASITFLENAWQALRTATAAVGAEHAVWSRARAATVPITTTTVVGRPTYLRTRNDRT